MDASTRISNPPLTDACVMAKFYSGKTDIRGKSPTIIQWIAEAPAAGRCSIIINLKGWFRNESGSPYPFSHIYVRLSGLIDCAGENNRRTAHELEPVASAAATINPIGDV